MKKYSKQSKEWMKFRQYLRDNYIDSTKEGHFVLLDYARSRFPNVHWFLAQATFEAVKKEKEAV